MSVFTETVESFCDIIANSMDVNSHGGGLQPVSEVLHQPGGGVGAAL